MAEAIRGFWTNVSTNLTIPWMSHIFGFKFLQLYKPEGWPLASGNAILFGQSLFFRAKDSGRK